MFPSSLFEVEYARVRDVQDLAETGEYGDNVGPARKLARLDDLVGLGGGSTFSKTEADGLYAPKIGSTEYATQFDVALGLSAKAEVGHTHSGLYQPWGDYLVAADITGKADKSTTYTKTEVDTALTTKSDTTHTHTGVYQPVGTYLTAADLTAALAPYALQSQLNALIGEVSDKADVAVLQGYVQKTELPVIPDDGYATNTQLTLGLASKANQTEVSNLSTLLNNNIWRVHLMDDRDWNTTLQPADNVTIPSDGVRVLTMAGMIPKWEYSTNSSVREIKLMRNRITGAQPNPNPPTSPNYTVLAIRIGGDQSADPGYIQQVRDVKEGWNYLFKVRAAYFDYAANVQPYMRLRVTNVAGGAVLAEQLFRTFATRPASVSQNNWVIFQLPFTFPDTTPGNVTLQIANMGPDTTTGATANGDTYLGIAEAYLVRVI